MPSRSTRPLQWHETEYGPMPDCGICLERMADPTYRAAISSVSTEHPENPAEIGHRFINHYHQTGHQKT